MPDDNREYRKELRHLMNSLAESVAEASDEEILEEVRAAGEDPSSEAERLREILMRAVSAHKRETLREARDSYEREAARIRHGSDTLRQSIEEKRKLLASIFVARPQLQVAFTMQFRDDEGTKAEELSEEEVDSYLRQLQDLGVLDEFQEGSRDE